MTAHPSSARALVLIGAGGHAREIIAQVEAISRAARLDIGGVEFLVDDRDGSHYFYDVNALSNFVADAPNVVGFDPWPRFVDYLVARATGERTGFGEAAEPWAPVPAGRA